MTTWIKCGFKIIINWLVSVKRTLLIGDINEWLVKEGSILLIVSSDRIYHRFGEISVKVNLSLKLLKSYDLLRAIDMYNVCNFQFYLFFLPLDMLMQIFDYVLIVLNVELL